MTIQTKQCPSDAARSFLDGRMDSAEQTEFELHLDRCPTCRQRLDDAVASTDQWDELRNSLATDGPASTLVIDQRRTVFHRPDDMTFYQRMLSPSDDPQMLGRVGSYEIVGLLGHGGMGVVFKGLDAPLNRFVAIKMMAPQFACSGAACQRFSREAQAAAAVVHEHVMTIHSVSQWQDTPYLVMPYIRGISLQKRIDDGGSLQLREILRIGMQVASALAAAHAQGLIHRDVKPANILMEEDVDRVVLTDFGLARAVDDIRLTRTDMLVGTPQYMSPEQSNDQSLDFRTDLFSLGSVLYECCTGRAAFQAVTSYGVLRKINDQQPRPICELNPDIPEWFAKFVIRLMAKNPAERFQTAAEVAELLQQCLSHVEQPHLTALPESLTRTRSPVPFFRRKSVMIATILSAIVALTAFAAIPGHQDEATTSVDAQEEKPDTKSKYATAAQAYQIGAAYTSVRDYKSSREPLEAAAKLADNDIRLKMKAYEALIPVYRQIPEFEPFQQAAEFVIENNDHDAAQSNMRGVFLSFAYNRGQTENLAKRYEKQLKKNPDSWLAVYMLSELYSNDRLSRSAQSDPKRAIELIEQLVRLKEKRTAAAGDAVNPERTGADTTKLGQQKAKLAAQYIKTGDFRTAALLYEEAAPMDKTTHAWNLKEAAAAAVKAGANDDALRLALAAENAPAESRGDLLIHYFHRTLGDTFIALNEPLKAIPHYEVAIEKTTIEGYINDTKASLEKARKNQ